MEPSTAETIFARAVELRDAAEREAYVVRACAGNAALLDSVSSLLRAHEQAAGFLGTEALVGGLTTRPCPEAGAAPDQGPVPPMGMSGAGAAPGPAGPPSEAAPPRIPGFRIERRLGMGGLGEVYAAQDEKLGRRVAIKVLRRRSDPSVRRRILDEARKIAALEDPAVVTVFSVLDESDPPAIVMEWVEGLPMDRFAAQLSFEQKARLLREVARGLASAHARGIVHRDLKPDNVLVGPAFRPRILDFGLALTAEEAARIGGGFEGTPLYASPEQARGEPLTPASDVFSLGALMFTVFTGRAPFEGRTLDEVLERIANVPPPFPRDVAVGVPEDLQAIVLACLSRDPAERPTAETVVLELGRYLAGEPVRLRPRLYTDLLRQRVSGQAAETSNWASWGILSRDEKDRFEVLHRRLLAEEDHWIIDARRLTAAQTVLYTSTWIVVVAAVLWVWLAREEIRPVWRWLAPVAATACLLGVGVFAERRRETLASASFLASAALSLVPTTLTLLKELRWLADAPAGVTQLFGDVFTNRQVLVSCLAAFVVSAGGLARLRLTGFAWTSAALGVAAYLAWLMERGGLDWRAYEQAQACLPLLGAAAVGLAFERLGRVRWSLPFHGIALIVLVAATDVMAHDGPTLAWLGIAEGSYLNTDRLRYFSLALNGLVFLGLMLVVERSRSLDLRRSAKALEILALLHAEGALFANADAHRADPRVRLDVVLYLAVAVLFLGVGAWRNRWRLLVGALAGLALGSYLVVDLRILPRTPFIVALGGTGLAVALLAFLYLVRAPRAGAGSKRPAAGPTSSPKAPLDRLHVEDTPAPGSAADRLQGRP